MSEREWARLQVEEVVAKYDEMAENTEPGGLRMCLQFAARIMRAEFLGSVEDGKRIAGRFEEASRDD